MQGSAVRGASASETIAPDPPPVHFAPGERTGRYRTGLDHPVAGEDGRARISYEDHATALVDDIETPRHLNRRFTAGY